MIRAPGLAHEEARIADVERIVVLRALQLGDVLCGTPALRALRRHFPRAHIAQIGLPWARHLMARLAHLVDEHIDFPGWPGLPEVPFDAVRATAFLHVVQARRFDLALQLHGTGRLTNALAGLLGARHVAGFHPEDEPPPAHGTFLPWPADEHEVTRPLRLLEHLGVESSGHDLELPLIDEDEALLTRAWPARLAPGSYGCVHPGARDPRRRWPPARFARVAEALAREGLRVVVTGSAFENELVRELQSSTRAPLVNTASLELPLGPLAALIAGARVIVCNDTGVSHVAAAVRTPSVVVFTRTSPARWAPLDPRRHRAIGPDDVTVERVVAAARAVLLDPSPGS